MATIKLVYEINVTFVIKIAVLQKSFNEHAAFL
jgi:hypothetical protein